MWMEHWSHWSLYQLTKYNFMLSQIFMEHWHFNMWFSLKYMYLVLSKFLVPGGHLSRHSHICRKNGTYFFQTSTDSYFYHLIHLQWPVPCWVCFPFGPGLVPFAATKSGGFVAVTWSKLQCGAPNVLFVGLVLRNILVTSSINCINHSEISIIHQLSIELWGHHIVVGIEVS